MIIPRITTPAIFHTYGSMRSDASGPCRDGVAARRRLCVVAEAIRYLKFRYRSLFLQAPGRMSAANVDAHGPALGLLAPGARLRHHARRQPVGARAAAPRARGRRGASSPTSAAAPATTRWRSPARAGSRSSSTARAQMLAQAAPRAWRRSRATPRACRSPTRASTRPCSCRCCTTSTTPRARSPRPSACCAPAGACAVMVFTREDIADAWCLDYFPSSRPWMQQTHMPVAELFAELPNAWRMPVVYEDVAGRLDGRHARPPRAAARPQAPLADQLLRAHAARPRRRAAPPAFERLERELRAGDGSAPTQAGHASVSRGSSRQPQAASTALAAQPASRCDHGRATRSWALRLRRKLRSTMVSTRLDAPKYPSAPRPLAAGSQRATPRQSAVAWATAQSPRQRVAGRGPS